MVGAGVEQVVEAHHSFLHVLVRMVVEGPGGLLPPEHGQLLDLVLLGGGEGGGGGAGGGLVLSQVVDKVASGAVRTEALLVIGPAQVCLVLRVALHRSEFLLTVGELAFVSVLADPLVLVRAAHLRLVP